MYGCFDYSLTRKLLVAISNQWDSHVLFIDKVAPPNWKVYYTILVFEFKFFKYLVYIGSRCVVISGRFIDASVSPAILST